MSLLLLILISLNQAILSIHAEKGQYLDAYNFCPYDDSTSLIGIATYVPNLDLSHIRLVKLVNSNFVQEIAPGGVYGHVTGLEVFVYQDSAYLVFSGDSGYINLLVASVQNLNNYRTSQIYGPFRTIRSFKGESYIENGSAHALVAFSYIGSNGEDSVVMERVNLESGTVQRWTWAPSSPTYPLDLGVNQLPGISIFHFYFLYQPQNNPQTYYPYILSFTMNGPIGEHYPFSLTDAQLPFFAAVSNFAVDFASRIEFPDSFMYEYSCESGTGSWHEPVKDSGLTHFYIEGFSIQDTSYFPHIYSREGKIYHRIFKFPSGSTEPLISEEMQISDTNNFADFPLVYNQHGALRNFYRPILKYSPSKSAMCVIWHQDFWHYTPTPPYLPVLDSTILWMDLRISPRVPENLTWFKIKWNLRESSLTITSNKQEEYLVEVYDVMGKLKLIKKVKSNTPEKLILTKKGIYFVKATAKMDQIR